VGGNYQRAIVRAILAGELDTKPGVSVIRVEHDDWCGVWQGGECNCRPVIQQRRTLPPRPGRRMLTKANIGRD
jgi:hypothetical protein